MYAEDFMDDGTPICLTMTIDRASRSAVLDFTGTGPEVQRDARTHMTTPASALVH